MTCPDILFRARCTLNSLTLIPPSKLSRASMVDSLVDASCKQDTSPRLCSTPTSKDDAANIVSRMVIWCNKIFPFMFLTFCIKVWTELFMDLVLAGYFQTPSHMGCNIDRLQDTNYILDPPSHHFVADSTSVDGKLNRRVTSPLS